jgi:hypothetical protein
MPLELRDTGMLKLFFADGLDQDQAVALLHSVRERSEHRAAMLRAIEPVAKAAVARRRFCRTGQRRSRALSRV